MRRLVSSPSPSPSRRSHLRGRGSGPPASARGPLRHSHRSRRGPSISSRPRPIARAPLLLWGNIAAAERGMGGRAARGGRASDDQPTGKVRVHDGGHAESERLVTGPRCARRARPHSGCRRVLDFDYLSGATCSSGTHPRVRETPWRKPTSRWCIRQRYGPFQARDLETRRRRDHGFEPGDASNARCGPRATTLTARGWSWCATVAADSVRTEARFYDDSPRHRLGVARGLDDEVTTASPLLRPPTRACGRGCSHRAVWSTSRAAVCAAPRA